MGDVERVEVGGDAVGAQVVGGLLAGPFVEFGDDDAVAVGADPAGRGQSEAAPAPVTTTVREPSAVREVSSAAISRG